MQPTTPGAKKSGAAKWIALAVVGALVVLFVVAFFVIKREVRLAIEEKCSSALQGTCSIDDLSIGGDGATASGVHIQASLGMASGDIESISVHFAWWPLITGSKQGITVKVVSPKIVGGLPIGNVLREARRMGEGMTSKDVPSRVRLDALVVERGDVRVSIPIVADVHVESIAVEWKREGGFSAEWADASLSTLLDSQHTGACKITEKKGGSKAHIACGKRTIDVDVDSLEDLTDLAKLLLKAHK